MGRSVESCTVFIIFFNYFFASSDDVGISYKSVDVGGNKELVQPCHFTGDVFTFPSPIALLSSFIRVRVSILKDVSEVELFDSSDDLVS